MRLRTSATIIILLGLFGLGCDAGTSCKIGETRCYENRAEECLGPLHGGDKDGEWKTYDDCPTQGLVCTPHLEYDIALNIDIAGCVSR